MERGSSKHGPARDEEMLHESQGMVQGTPQRPHTEEWRETEPLDDALPPVDRGQEEREPDIADRSELARVMTRDVFPADRASLLRRLADSDAPPTLVDRVSRLPAGQVFASVHDVLQTLGITSPETRLADAGKGLHEGFSYDRIRRSSRFRSNCGSYPSRLIALRGRAERSERARVGGRGGRGARYERPS